LLISGLNRCISCPSGFAGWDNGLWVLTETVPLSNVFRSEVQVVNGYNVYLQLRILLGPTRIHASSNYSTGIPGCYPAWSLTYADPSAIYGYLGDVSDIFEFGGLCPSSVGFTCTITNWT